MSLLTIPQLAAELNLPENWVRRKVTARAIPFTRIGKHVRFTEAHVQAIIGAGEQTVLDNELRPRRGRRTRL